MDMFADLSERLRAEQKAKRIKAWKQDSPNLPSPFEDYGKIGERKLLYPPKCKKK